MKRDFSLMSDKLPAKAYKYAIPACCDLISSLLEYISIIKLTGSTYQFMINATILTTSGFAYILTKTPLNRNQIWGGVIALIALMTASASVLFDQDSGNDQGENFVMGLLLMLAAVIIKGFYFSY